MEAEGKKRPGKAGTERRGPANQCHSARVQKVMKADDEVEWMSDSEDRKLQLGKQDSQQELEQEKNSEET